MSEDLHVKITGANEAGPAAQAAARDYQAFERILRDVAKGIVLGVRDVTDELKKEAEAFEKLGDKAEKESRRVRDSVGRVGADAKEIGGFAQGLGDEFEDAFSGQRFGQNIASQFLVILGPIALVAAGVAGVKAGLQALTDLSVAGARKADEIYDLDRALERVTGSAEAARETLAHFADADASGRIRSQADDLARVYARLKEIAEAKGFDPVFLREFTVNLDQFATATGNSVDEIVGSYEQLLSGRVSGGNTILKVLGLTKEDVEKDGGWQLVIDGIRGVAKEGEAMGQTFDSAMAKAKDAIITGVANGFNVARGEAQRGMAGIVEAVNDPELQRGLEAIGGGAASFLEFSGRIALRWEAIANAIERTAKQGIWSAAGPAGWLAGTATNFDEGQAAVQERLFREAEKRRSQWDLLGRGVADQLASGPSRFALGNDWRGYGANTPADVYVRQLGIVKAGMSDPQFESFLRRINDSLADAVLTWDEFKKAKEAALAPTNSGGGPRGGLGGGAVDDADEIAKRTDELRAQIEIFKATDPYYRARIQFFIAEAEAAKEARAAVEALFLVESKAKPLIEGNIDLAHRPIARNADGSISTVRSMSFGSDQGEASRYAEDLHKQQEAMYATAEATGDLTAKLASYHRVLDNGGPMAAAEIEHLRDLREAARSATPELQKLGREWADINHQSKLDRVLTDALKAGSWAGKSVAGKISNAPGTTTWEESRDLRDHYEAKSHWEMRIAEERGDRERQLRLDTERRAIEMWREAHYDILREFATIIEALARGGDAFGASLEGHFNQLVSRGADTLATAIFGRPGDTALGEDPAALYNLSGEKMSGKAESRARAAGMGLDIASAGYGAYAGARSGEGARTAGVISGAMAGAAFSLPGIIIGAVVGAIGGWLGEQQRQSEYKYGIPGINKEGVATFTGTRNIETAEYQQMITQIQDRFDTVRNAYMRILLRVPESILPELAAIDGKFQPRPSQHFLKHFNQWLTGTLPDDIAEQFRGSMEKVYTQFGLSVNRFNELWNQFDTLDPSKAAAMWGSLLESLMSIADSTKVLGAVNGWGQNTSWFQTMMEERRLQNRNLPQAMREDYYDKIIDKGRGLYSLVGEDQIAALREVAELMGLAAEANRQAARELIVLQDRAHEEAANLRDKFTLMGMRNKDGSIDHEAQVRWYQGRADSDLSKIASARNAQEVDRYRDDFNQMLERIVEAGYAISPEMGEKYRLWAMEQISKGEDAAQARYDALGRQMNDENARFMEKWQPIFDDFSKDLEGAGTDVVDTIDGRVIPALDRFAGGLNRWFDELDSRIGGSPPPSAPPPDMGSYGGVVVNFPPVSASSVVIDTSSLAAEIRSLQERISELLSIIAANTGDAADSLAAMPLQSAGSSFASQTAAQRTV